MQKKYLEWYMYLFISFIYLYFCIMLLNGPMLPVGWPRDYIPNGSPCYPCRCCCT